MSTKLKWQKYDSIRLKEKYDSLSKTFTTSLFGKSNEDIKLHHKTEKYNLQTLDRNEAEMLCGISIFRKKMNKTNRRLPRQHKKSTKQHIDPSNQNCLTKRMAIFQWKDATYSATKLLYSYKNFKKRNETKRNVRVTRSGASHVVYFHWFSIPAV